MTTPAIRDALAMARINTMKRRNTSMQALAIAKRTEERLAVAMLAAASEGVQMLRRAHEAGLEATPEIREPTYRQ